MISADILENFRKRLYRFANFEQRRKASYTPENFSLDNQIKLLKALGNPHLSFKSIHVAGTKGKGSVVRLISQLVSNRMECKGFSFKVGSYYSPHIIEERERFEIDGKVCDFEKIIPIFDQVMSAIENKKLSVTVFDIFTATAFLLFASEKVDLAVIETGLGGRLDSTNVLQPELSVITRIDYDHMEKLGKNLQEIATEKAGIIKKGVPLVYLKSHEAVSQVMIKTAKEKEAEIISVDPTEKPAEKSGEKPSEKEYLLKDFPLWMMENIALAKKVVDKFFLDFGDFAKLLKENPHSEKDFDLSVFAPIEKREIDKVLNNFNYPGRYQFFERLVFDGAHVPYSLRLLIASIKKDTRLQNISQNGVVLAFFAFFDKDVEGLVKEIPKEWDFVFVRLSLPFLRQELVEETLLRAKKTRQQLGANFFSVDSVDDLMKSYFLENRLYVFTGGFRLIGAVQKFLLEKSFHFK